MNKLKDKKLIETVYYNMLSDYRSKETKEFSEDVIPEMISNTSIRKCINTLVRGVLSRDLIVKSEVEDEKGTQVLEIQKRINKVKNKTTFINNLVMSVFTTKCLHEIIYNEDYTIDRFEEYPNELIKYDNSNNLWYVELQDKKVELENNNKFILSVYNSTIRNKKGISLLEEVYEDYLKLKEINDKLRYIVDKYGDTIIVFAYSEESDEQDIQRTAEEIKKAKGKNVIAIPLSDGNLRDNLWTLRLSDIDTIIHERLIDRYEKNIITTLLGSSLTIQNDGSSSYALGEIHQEEKEKVEDSIALYVRDELDKIIDIDALFYGYDPAQYYIGLERTEKEEETIKKEKSKAELLGIKATNIEILTRANIELDEEELKKYLGFEKIKIKEDSL